MKNSLMGSETEYAVSGRCDRGPVAAEEIYSLLNEAVRGQCLWIPDVSGGRAIYLENGGRLYLDAGAHPEYASPECSTPAEVTCYDKAGERILEQARARVNQERPALQLTIVKNNISSVLPDRVSWGNHEAYTCWVPLERAAPQLIPHLVSRIIYAGAGCLSAHPQSTSFELSQRARHLVLATGSETMFNRAIFCTRIRKAADYSRDGWVRAHLIAKDSHRAPLGIFLTFGTTGLLFRIMNEKRPVGKGLDLADPVKALRTISQDPWLRARVALADGRHLTALEIQESYLAECEREVQHGGFPEWAAEVIRHWRETLAALAKDPLRMAGRLDPYCKLLITDHELRRARYGWSDLHQALKVMTALHERYPAVVIQALLAEDPNSLSAEMQVKYAEAVAEAGTKRAGVLDRLRFAVRLQALDLNYHELGGLYDQLAASGQVQDVVATAADVERAMRQPPSAGRAAVRSECIKSLRGPGWVCDWCYLWHASTGTFVDLRNPFETQRRTEHRDRVPAES